MVNLAKIERLTRNLREYITHLQNLGDLGQGAILADPYKRGAARILSPGHHRVLY